MEHKTDVGNARQLVKKNGEKLRYVRGWGWMVWNGQRWQRDDTGKIFRLAKDTVEAMYSEAHELADDDNRKAMISHCLKSEGDARIKAMVSQAKSEEEVVGHAEDFDTNTMLLNCLNGTIDLKTGELLKHRKSDLITKIAPVEYNPDAVCPLWEKFIEKIMDRRKDLIAFRQKEYGYSLTGSTQEQCIFIHYGPGANGKSVEINVMKSILGDYASVADASTFLRRQQDRIPNDIARLVGARLVLASEIESGRQLSEVLVKQMTGEDTVSARFLHKEYFEFQPAFKIILITNHRPSIKGTDHAIWRRVRLIPFEVTIPAKEQDLKLTDKLRGELPGILAWAVRGCLQWQLEGLGSSPEITDATDEYKRDEDYLADFIEEHCLIEDQETVNKGSLYRIYAEWAESNKEKVISKKAFGTLLKEKGFSDKNSTKGRVWLGLSLIKRGFVRKNRTSR